MVAIHQFHSGSAIGDAVTNSMFFIQDILLKQGFVSEIYAEHIAPELTESIRHYSQYQPAPDDVMLIHHSMGHEQTDWILGLPVTKILVYHNITPSGFFPVESPFRHYAKVGREQLAAFLPEIKASIADSGLNAEELRACGYEDVSVIPLLLDIEVLRQRIPDPAILNKTNEAFTLLFVGRITSNKCQHDLIEILDRMVQTSERPVQLVLVGGYDPADEYYLRLLRDIELAGLEDSVTLTGKVSDQELTAWYKVSDVFVCMSEHEGFGVPLIEAMVYDLPVIAYKSSNISSTMAGAGLVVGEKKLEDITALLLILSKDRILQRALIRRQRKRIQGLSRDKVTSSLLAFLSDRLSIPVPTTRELERGLESESVHYQVEGPFETSYSLALVNREVAFALNELAPSEVGLFATEGPGDYEPDIEVIEAIPGLKELADRGEKKSRADVVIRNLYPPRVVDMDGLVNLLDFAWEESCLPLDFVDDFNRYLDGIAVTSRFVKKVIIDNGVALPVHVVGNGFDHIKRTPSVSFEGALPSGFKFLHISSCFPRKGVDVLLESFCSTFSNKDDVSLVIKTFPNVHNTTRQQVDALRLENENCPNIKIIDCDLPAGQVVDLYRQCDAFVAPSRGEGFGLPMAEAMWHGLPVITTGFGGQADFCTEKTSWLIDYSFEPAKTHMGLYDSVWVEPDAKHLGSLMHEVWSAKEEDMRSRLHAAKQLLETKFTWQKCANRLIRLEEKILRKKPRDRRKINLGWISSWNTKCGIATYSEFLLNMIGNNDIKTVIFASSDRQVLSADEKNVIRCWKNKNHGIDQLIEALDSFELDVIVIQFNWAFFSLVDLAQLIIRAKKKGMTVVVMFHVTRDLTPPYGPASLQSIGSELSLADRLLVHGVDDLNRLREWGLVDNVTLFPHGVQARFLLDGMPLRETYGIAPDAVVIASYGFLLPHKGIEQLLEAFSILKQEDSKMMLVLVNALYPSPSPSRKIKERCTKLMNNLGVADSVLFETSFLSNQESMSLLSMADLFVLPYQKTDESSSAAVRAVLPLNKPIAVSPLTIFQDVHDVVHLLPGTSAESIARGIKKLLSDPDKLFSRQSVQNKWLKAHSWTIVARRLGGMLKGLVEENEC